MTTLHTIETFAGTYAAVRQELADIMRELEDEIQALKRRRLPKIRMLAERAAGAIDEAPELFANPRTYVFSGIKVGLQKGVGRVEYADAARVVQLILKHLPDQAETLIKTTETPLKGMLAKLPADTLARLGCTLTGAEDAVLIKPTDGEIDKLVDALLADALASEELPA